MADSSSGSEPSAAKAPDATTLNADANPDLDLDETLLDFSMQRGELSIGSRIGSYRLVAELGRGGMGIVYRATREDGLYKQDVAVKVLSRLGSEVEALLFARERQILADLDHPGIARLLDGGMTSAGAPYLILELVEGLPIDQHCRLKSLDLPQRLEIFCAVCRAVQSAHQRLVIHRDIKPSNILVTDDGEAKLLDFGIAKLIASGDRTTVTAASVMTPEWASPEQLAGGQVSIATDVYQLGLLLYLLIADQQPFEGSSLSEIWRRIVEDRPKAPSEVKTGPRSKWRLRSFAPDLLRDIDTIALKALRKAEADRYSTVDHLREDVERAHAGLPILARPATLRERLRKLVHRHRPTFVVAGIALVLLVVLVVGAGVRLAEERDYARQEADRAEFGRQEAEAARQESFQVTELLASLFSEANPTLVGDRQITARQLLDRGAVRLASELADQPRARARLEEALARAYLGLADLDEAHRHIELALDLDRSLPETDASGISAFGVQAPIMSELGRYSEAAQVAHHSVEQAERLNVEPLQLAAALEIESTCLARLGRLDEAEGQIRRAHRLLAAMGIGGSRMARVEQGLAEVLSTIGRNQEAREYIDSSLARIEGDDSALHLRSQILITLGAHLRRESRWKEAEASFRESLEITHRLYGTDSPAAMTPLVSLSFLTQKTGDLKAAEALYRQALALPGAARRGEARFRAKEGLAVILRSTGRADEAVTELENVLAESRELQGAASSDIAWILYELGATEAARGNAVLARTRFHESLKNFVASVGPRHHWTSWPLHQLGLLDLAAGDLAAAKENLEQAYEARSAHLTESNPDLAETRKALEEVRRRLDREMSARQ